LPIAKHRNNFGLLLTICDVFQGCDGQTRRRRHRIVVRHPAPAGKTDHLGAAHPTRPASSHCPHLEEFERCDNSVVDCRTYTWRWTSWSMCLLPDSVPGVTVERLEGVVTPCGVGRRFRYAECVRSDGQVVAEQFCRQHLPVCNSSIVTSDVA